MALKVCPDCGNGTFIVRAIEHHDWIVDSMGEFVRDWACYDSKIIEDTTWICTECKAEYSDNTQFVSNERGRDD